MQVYYYISLMKKTTGILLLLFTCFSFCKSTIAQNITEQDYYSFLNAIGATDSAKSQFISSKSAIEYFHSDSSTVFHGNMPYTNGASDTLFTMADIKFMKQQLTRGANYIWKSKKIKWANIIPYKDIDKVFATHEENTSTAFYKKYPTNIFYDYSIPLFSTSKLLCAIYIGSYCGGLCGSGAFYIYENKGGKWVLIRYYHLWVS